MKYLISFHKDKVIDHWDQNGLNLVSFCVQEFSWGCLTEIIKALGHEVLDKTDPSIGLNALDLAKSLDFEQAYQDWMDSLVAGHKIDWERVAKEEESRTMIMFHGKLNL